MSLDTTELSMSLQPNEVVLFVDLPQDALASGIEELKQLGFNPQPKHYTWYQNGDSDQPIHETCLLLHRSISDEPEALFSELETQWEKLTVRFGEDSVNLAMGTND